jgi:hypothetical protein
MVVKAELRLKIDYVTDAITIVSKRYRKLHKCKPKVETRGIICPFLPITPCCYAVRLSSPPHVVLL